MRVRNPPPGDANLVVRRRPSRVVVNGARADRTATRARLPAPDSPPQVVDPRPGTHHDGGDLRVLRRPAEDLCGDHRRYSSEGVATRWTRAPAKSQTGRSRTRRRSSSRATSPPRWRSASGVPGRHRTRGERHLESQSRVQLRRHHRPPRSARMPRRRESFAKSFIELRTELAAIPGREGTASARAQLASCPIRRTARSAPRSSEHDPPASADACGHLRDGHPGRSGGPPASPESPHPVRSALVALFVALIGGVALAYAFEALDRRPRRLEEFSGLYGLPLLAALPVSNDSRPETARRAWAQPEGTPQAAPNQHPARGARPTGQAHPRDERDRGRGEVHRRPQPRYRPSRGRLPRGRRRQRPSAACAGPVLRSLSEPGLTNVLTGQSELAMRSWTSRWLSRASGRLCTSARIGPPRQRRPATAGGRRCRDRAPSAGPQPPDPQTVLAAERTHGLLISLHRSTTLLLWTRRPSCT